MTEDRIEQLLSKADDLPVLPHIAMEILNLIEDKTSVPEDFESVIENDQVMTLKILKIANSAYYGYPRGNYYYQRSDSHSRHGHSQESRAVSFDAPDTFEKPRYLRSQKGRIVGTFSRGSDGRPFDRQSHEVRQPGRLFRRRASPRRRQARAGLQPTGQREGHQAADTRGRPRFRQSRGTRPRSRSRLDRRETP